MEDKLYIIGYYGYDNLGDEAMKLGLLEILKYKGYENIICHSNGQGYFKNFLWSDVIILGGGTHLRNWGHNWLYQSSRILLLGIVSKIFNKKFCMFNVGIDGEILESLAKNTSDIVTLREIETFDSSIVLKFDSLRKKKILGISLTPYYETFFDDCVKDKHLVQNLIYKVNKWLEDKSDWDVRFFSFNKLDEDLNEYASTLVNRAEYIEYDNNVFNNLKIISECSAFIGMRYHSCQFAYKTDTPLLVINTYPSCQKFAKFVGVNLVNKEDILDNNFELSFKKASLDLNTAKSLAFKGVVV